MNSRPSIYSGLYAPSGGRSDHTWVGRALIRQLEWCGERGIDYRFVASTMHPWASYATYPNSWTFGTMVKFMALKDFLSNPKGGDRFSWMDLDVYPEDNARLEDLTDLGENVLAAPATPPTFCGYPGLYPAHLHMFCKLLWTGLHDQPNYLALSSGMFTLSRAAAGALWGWLNRKHLIDTQPWWDEYAAKQLTCAEHARRLGHTVDPFMFGSEEALLEDWLNSTGTMFTQFGFNIHGLCDSRQKHKFTHYYGGLKALYPVNH